MTPVEFVREIVIPTLEDFRADRTSRRWAYLSAITVYHLRDYLAEALAAERSPVDVVGPADVKRAMAEVDEALRAARPDLGALEIVRAVCNGSKHAIGRSGDDLRFTAGSDWERPPAIAGRMMCGLSQCGDLTGGREIPHGEKRLDVYHAVQTTFLSFLAAFPVQLDSCTFDPYPEIVAT